MGDAQLLYLELFQPDGVLRKVLSTGSVARVSLMGEWMQQRLSISPAFLPASMMSNALCSIMAWKMSNTRESGALR